MRRNIHRGFRERRTRGVFPVKTRVRFNSVVVEAPTAYRNIVALSVADARSLSRSLSLAADAIERHEARR